jgi:hypothetical protein
LTEADNIVDKRTARRFPLKLPMAVKAGAREHETETSNISAAGVLFEVDADVPIGTVIEFAITMPAAVVGGPVDVQVNCIGRVVRCSQQGDCRKVAAVIDEYRFQRP